MSDVRLARDGVRSLRGRSRPAPHSPNHEPDSAALTTSAERKLKLAQIGLRRVCAGVRKHRGGARTHDGRYSIGGRRRSGGRAESCRANQHRLGWRRPRMWPYFSIASSCQPIPTGPRTLRPSRPASLTPTCGLRTCGHFWIGHGTNSGGRWRHSPRGALRRSLPAFPSGWLHARRDTTAAAHATLRGIAARSLPDGQRNTTMASAVIR